MDPFETLRIWFALRKAKQEETKHILSKNEILDIDKDLRQKEMILNKLIKQNPKTLKNKKSKSKIQLKK